MPGRQGLRLPPGCHRAIRASTRGSTPSGRNGSSLAGDRLLQKYPRAMAFLLGGEDDSLAVWQPTGPAMVKLVIGDAWASPAPLGSRSAESVKTWSANPLAVAATKSTHWPSPSRTAESSAVLRKSTGIVAAAAYTLFIEKQALAIGRQLRGKDSPPRKNPALWGRRRSNRSTRGANFAG